MAVEVDLKQLVERVYRRGDKGTLVPCSASPEGCPDPGELRVKLGEECGGGVCTTSVELRLAKTLLDGSGEIGIAFAHVGYRQGSEEISSWTAAPSGVDTSRPETWARAFLAPESPGEVEPGGEIVFLDVTASALPRFCDLIDC